MNIRRIYSKLALLAILGLMTACQNQGTIPSQLKVGKPYVIDGKSYYPQYDETYDRTGEASWYGPGFHGKFTADGEVFDQNDITAAHPTLPMPSIVRVTNLENGKSLLVRINDRGPFKSNRIIDLSKHAAEVLGVRSLARVRVQYLPQETQEFLASVQGGHPMTMAEFNDRPAAPPPQIVEASVATTTVGNPVADAAPVMTVSTTDIATSQNAPADTSSAPTTTTTTTTTTVTEAVDQEPVEEPAAQPGLITPVQARTISNEPAGSPVQLAGAPDNTEVTDAGEVEAAGEPVPQVKHTKAKATHVLAAPAPGQTQAAPSSGGHYIILAGAFASKENADNLVARLSSVAPGSTALVSVGGKSLWRVHFGPFGDEQSAEDALAQVRTDGAPDARITHQ